VLSHPLHKFLARQITNRQIKHDVLLCIDGCIKFRAVYDEECFHLGMSDSLIPIDKGMIENQCEA